MASSDDVVEDETNEGPWHVVICVCGRNVADAVEDDGKVDVFRERERPSSLDQVSSDGHDGTK